MTAGNEQYKIQQSYLYLDRCCELISEKMGNTTIASWSNGEYIKLSGLLYRNTAVQISPSTLKRIFGKVKTTERYYPQKATRDALAQYAGFSNWDRFVSEQNNTIPINETGTSILVDRPLINPPASASPSRKSRIKRYRIIIVLLAIGAALLLFRQITKTKNSSAPDLAGAKLICKNPIGENPHSAEFIVRLPDQFSGDTSKFKVDFDDRRSEKNVPANKTFTYYYELPGSHYAILKYDGVPVDTAVILLRTNGWNATGVMQHDTTRVYPLTEFIIDGVKPLTVTPTELFHSGVDTNRTFYVHFVNAKKSGINGDNFELTAGITTSPLRPGVRCSQVNIEVFGEGSKDVAEVIKPGCITWARLQFSEIHVAGQTSDLRSIGADLSEGGIIKLRVQNKNVHFSLNDKLIYETTYKHALGTINGIDINFAGIGSIKNFGLKDLKSGEQF